MNMIQIQDELIESLNAGFARWAHRKNGGHSRRVRRGALRTAEKKLQKLGYEQAQIDQILRDAEDVAKLNRECEE